MQLSRLHVKLYRDNQILLTYAYRKRGTKTKPIFSYPSLLSLLVQFHFEYSTRYMHKIGDLQQSIGNRC